MPIESFLDPYRGLDQEARVDKMVEAIERDSPPSESTSDWPRVHTAICRDGLFVLEATRPSLTVMLRFDPNRNDAGDYEIHHLPHGGIEKGRTTKVITVADGEKDAKFSMLMSFPARFAVATVGSARPHAKLMWLVGLSSFRSVSEKDETDETTT